MKNDKADILISIIIPMFNLEKFIAETLNSVLNQETPLPYEIIVIDDGSTDDSYNIVQQISEKNLNISLFKNKLTKGVSGSRNTGLKNAQGEWIAFLDGDDIWDINTINKKMSIANKNPDIEFISSGYIDWFYQEKKSNSIREQHNVKPFIKNTNENYFILESPVNSLLDCHQLAWTGTVFVKKELVQKTGFFNDIYKMSQDRDYWLRLAARTKSIAYINEDLSWYRKRSGSQTRRGIPGTIWMSKVLSGLIHQPEFLPYRKNISKYLSQYLLNNSYYYSHNKKYISAISEAIKSLRYDISNHSALRRVIASLLFK